MLEDSQFHCLADAYLESLADEVDEKDQAGHIDADINSGVLMLELESGKQFLISKHTPTQQIWLSSPVSGGLHFRYNENDSAWELEDGRKLGTLLADELQRETGLNFSFAL